MKISELVKLLVAIEDSQEEDLGVWLNTKNGPVQVTVVCVTVAPCAPSIILE